VSAANCHGFRKTTLTAPWPPLIKLSITPAALGNNPNQNHPTSTQRAKLIKATLQIQGYAYLYNCQTNFCLLKEVLLYHSITTVREGQFRQTSAKIEFPHQICRGPYHPKPITRCHVALFDKIYLIYAEIDPHVR
jgi:hypothetical protein